MLQQPAEQARHYIAAWRENPRAVAALADDFTRMRNALAKHIEAKRAYIVERGMTPAHTLDPACLATINSHGRDAFFRRAPTHSVRASVPTIEFAWTLK